MTDATDVRDVVRDRYAAAATASGGSGCCDGAVVITPEQRQVFGAELYEQDDREQLPEAARLASLGWAIRPRSPL